MSSISIIYIPWYENKLPVEEILPPPVNPSFVASIKSNPRDWTNRLIYADWLEEHGEDNRANKIRQRVHTQQQDGKRKCLSCKGTGSKGQKLDRIRTFVSRFTGKKEQQPIYKTLLCEVCLGEGRVPTLRNLAWILGYGED